jgi:hypothetical protein
LIIPNGCGAGAQAGGSSRGGAAIAGIAWTTDECYAFILAQSYQAIGNSEAACEALNHTKVALRLQKLGMPAAVCVRPAVVVTKIERVDTSGFATKEELAAAFKQSQRK